MFDFLSSPYMLPVAIVVAVLLSVLQVRQSGAMSKMVREYGKSTGEKVKSTEGSDGLRNGFLVAAIACAAGIVVLAVKPDLVKDARVYMTFCAIMAILLITNFLTFDVNQKIYYTKEGFFLKEGYFLFRDIAKLEQTTRVNRVIMTDGKTLQVNPKQMADLEQLRQERVYRQSSGQGKN